MEVVKIFFETFQIVFEKRKTYYKPLISPVFLLIFLSVNQKYTLIPIKEWIAWIAEFTTTLMLTITTYRFFILGEQSVSSSGFYRPTYRELSFIMHMIGLSFFTLPIALIASISIIPEALGIIITTPVILYIFSRFALVMPAIASDHGWSFSDSWRSTKKCKFFVFTVVALIPWAISQTQYIYLVSELTYYFYPIFLIFYIALLSTIYSKITEEKL